jgi:polyphosphate kinase 2 (PPK2 family)
VVVLKFFLHVSKKEQKQRLLERLDDPRKYWKFSSDDVKEREYWKDYMAAFETMVRRTATKHAPWYVVPADNKWFTRAVVAAAIVDALGSLDLHHPEMSPARLTELAQARRALRGKA